MRLSDGISVGIKAIYSNKLRSLLTMFGIIIGIAAVIAMIAIGDGAKEIILQDLQKIGGINQFTLYRTTSKWVNGRRVPIRSGEHFNYGDVLAIEAECPSVKAVTPRIPNWTGVLIQAPGGVSTRSGYNGVNATYTAAMDWNLHEGRFISDQDVDNATKVVVLGSSVATELFGVASPLGKEIKIGKKERFTVIGTLAPRGQSLKFGFSFDELVFIPITTTQQRFTGNDRILQIAVKAHTVEVIPKAIEEVKSVMRKRHNNQDYFFVIFDIRAGIAELGKISKVIKIALGSIAGFSLLVGGIGIMNMMLVAVAERTREIGLRKALGAKSLDILFQFLIESVVMCSIGGLIGVGFGIFAGKGMAHLAVKIVKIVPEWPAVLSARWILISVSFSAAIGIGFGLYPAIKAMKLSPIEALRTE
ncbi:FtsX-like permease family protein [Candidatus Poribacteria bacterium]|nr:FtsX-like permease family protein [Candidatus Poribacteria bacterium]